ncbi:MAG: hypothetical protein PHP44_15790 [Kiritimatiellae bacterium]|nr:hypothetical protein [Kiritimatiellia bacterium]
MSKKSKKRSTNGSFSKKTAKNGCFFVFFVLFTLIFSVSGLAVGTGEADEVLGFADHLFEQTDYYRAITEYERYLFFMPESPRAPWVRYRIAESYLRGEQYEEAMLRFGKLAA